jgi:PhzF family phenazine biosynthesis protein
MSTTQRFTQVDAFTDSAFAGNPAAVCLLPAPREERWMQLVAREMNLAETAFLIRRPEGFDLRWFTPTLEVDLCGHATLASAHALWEEGAVEAGKRIHFHTRSGVLEAIQDQGLIWLDFPATPATTCPAPAALTKGLGVTTRYVGRTAFDYLVELESAEVVRSIAPDFASLGQLPVRGIIVTAASDDRQYDFVSRFFAPASGIPEDPVTGSAHAGLAPYWAARFGRKELMGYQASSRGGTVRVRLDGERVHLGGYAITILRGELLH